MKFVSVFVFIAQAAMSSVYAAEEPKEVPFKGPVYEIAPVGATQINLHGPPLDLSDRLDKITTSLKPIEDFNKDCDSKKTKDKTKLCAEFDGPVAAKGDLIFDCKMKSGICGPGEEIYITKHGLKYRHIGFFKFDNTNNGCDDEHPMFAKRSFNEVAKIMVKNGLLKNQSVSKIYEEVQTFLSAPFETKAGPKTWGHCMTLRTGWVLDNFLTKQSLESHSVFNHAVDMEAKCADCTEEDRKGMRAYEAESDQVLIRTVLKKADEVVQKERRKIGEKIKSCDGTVTLPSISVTMRKVKVPGKPDDCVYTFPKDCQDHTKSSFLVKAEQLVNTITLSAPEPTATNKRCMDAKESLSQQCGPRLYGNKKNPDETFAYARAITKNILASKKYSDINVGTMLCIFARETSDYDLTSLNFRVCDQKDRVGLRKPGVLYTSQPIWDGRTSSAGGLGGVVLKTACYAVQRFPENYPEIDSSKLKKISCETNEAKKIVEPYFEQAATDMYKQINLSTDALKLSLEQNKGVKRGALWSYGDQTQAYVNYVNACEARCFAGRPLENTKLSCLNGVKEEQAAAAAAAKEAATTVPSNDTTSAAQAMKEVMHGP